MKKVGYVGDLKLWKCKNGHATGEVQWRGHGESSLLLFRNSVGEGGEDLEVAAVFDGLGTVTASCSICGGKRTWVPGEEAIERLMARRAKMWGGG